MWACVTVYGRERALSGRSATPVPSDPPQFRLASVLPDDVKGPRVDIAFRQRLHWLVMHGFVRGAASFRRSEGATCSPGLIADPTVKARSGAVLRGGAGPRPAGAVPDRLPHGRPRDRARTAAIRRFPGALDRVESAGADALGGAVAPAMICFIRCVPRRCWPSSRRTTPATGKRCRRCSPRGRSPHSGIGVEQTASIAAGSAVRRARRRRYRRPILRAASGRDHQRHLGRARRGPTGASWSSVNSRRPVWTSGSPGGSTDGCSAASQGSAPGWTSICSSCGVARATT